MTIEKKLEGTTLTMAVSGRLDTGTSPQLKAALETSLSGVKLLVLDFSDLQFITSAGLRVLLFAQKAMNKQGKLVITHVNEIVYDVFKVTKYCDFLTIERA